MGELKKQPKRFSDEELAEFYEDYKLHKKEEIQQSNRLLECQNDLKHAIESLAKSVNDNKKNMELLSNNTKEMVEFGRDARGTVRVISILGKFFKWLSGLGFVGWIFLELAKHADKVK